IVGDAALLANREELQPEPEVGVRRIRDERLEGRLHVRPLVVEVHREARVEPDDHVERGLLGALRDRGAAATAALAAVVSALERGAARRRAVPAAGVSAVALAG